MGFYEEQAILNEKHITLFDALKFRTVFQMMHASAENHAKISNMDKIFLL